MADIIRKLLRTFIGLIVFTCIALPVHAFDIITVQVTGSSAISYSLEPRVGIEMIDFRLHLGSTPTTSENFTVTVNAGAGAVYDLNSPIPIRIPLHMAYKYGMYEKMRNKGLNWGQQIHQYCTINSWNIFGFSRCDNY